MRALVTVGLAFLMMGCAELQGLRQLVQPPSFEQDPDQPAELLLPGLSAGRPRGTATVRIWARVTNPNPFGLTLRTLTGTLFLEGARAATADFPLGLPLGPGQVSVVPLDLSLSLADLPGLADVVRRASRGEPLAYRLDGSLGVDAGRLGQPGFGPMTLTRGDLRTPRLSPAARGAKAG